MHKRKRFTLYLTVILLFLTSNLLASDSLSVRQAGKKVKIGPEELKPQDILDSVVMRKLLFEDYLKGKSTEKANIQQLKKLETLFALLPDSLSSIKSRADLDSLENKVYGLTDLQNQLEHFSSIAVFYGRAGGVSTSSKFFFEALKIAESLEDQKRIAAITEKLAVLYQLEGRFSSAISTLEYNIKVNLALRQSLTLAQSYLLLAQSKLSLYRYKEAEYCILNKALPLFRRYGSKDGKMKSFLALGNLYFDQERLSEAKWFYLQAKLMADKTGDTNAKADILIRLAEVKTRLGDTRSAISDLKAAEINAKQAGNLLALVIIKSSLGELYHEAGNDSLAGYAIEEYKQLKNDLFKTAQL